MEQDQSALWNGAAGRAWVDQQALLDTAFEPIEHWLAEVAARAQARRVLDVGCGTGSTTLAIARRLAPAGQCLGVDISAPMIARARDRAGQAQARAAFAEGDAETYAFAPDTFDLIVSRFGVMFFRDPVAAFANVRRSAQRGGALTLLVWRGPEENAFMTTAERAAAPLLPQLPPRKKDGPGQFAFADPARVRLILAQAGWSDIGIEAVDFACAFPRSGLASYVTRLGPVGLFLQGADEAIRSRIVDAVLPAFDGYVDGAEVRFVAACWKIVARKSADISS
ncbi:class I SAM-dependent methyltransferase [Sphingosinicella terrae]|uniref:class I SAM-dependent methyltransferase n=1 Tax=Sphingosinicella terrae TaxID=2172047 RepID=UPI00254726EA|nr:class I SAM-dependent methyltransferase [Sphingosinicella terrae]